MRDEVRTGDRYEITRVEQPAPEAYAVVHYGPYGFPCSRRWCEAEDPAVGKFIVMGADGHWHVERR